jgi:uncharacterized protein (DUF2236 family)
MPASSYFSDDSILRRVHRERLIGLGGPRALLLMAAHPVAFEGFFAQTGALDDPYARLRRTAEVLETITYGDRCRADVMTRRVRALHRQVRGELPETAGRFPAGTPYAADDPELLLWILAALAQSNLLVYDRYVRPLSPDARDRYWQDFKVIGRLFGLRRSEMPRDIEAFDAYMQAMLDGPDLFVTERARQLAIEIVLHPPVPLAARPLVELANFITVGLLPDRLRREYRFSWDPVRRLALAGGAEYARRLLMPLLPGRVRHFQRAAA